MGPTWVLSAPDGPHVGTMNLAIRKCVIYKLEITIHICITETLHDTIVWFFFSTPTPVVFHTVCNRDKQYTHIFSQVRSKPLSDVHEYSWAIVVFAWCNWCQPVYMPAEEAYPHSIEFPQTGARVFPRSWLDISLCQMSSFHPKGFLGSLLLTWFNSFRLRQNGRLFADDILKRIFLNENIRILTKNSLKFVPKGLINNIPALVLIMAWRPPGDKPLSEPMLVRSLTHICVTRPQWVNVNPSMDK